jgi:hypothetical protein
MFKADKSGRLTTKIASSRDKKMARQWPDEPFIQLGLSFLASPAWKELSGNAKAVFSRLQIEHMEHGGYENGRLPCTYSDFEKYGVRRKSISKALDELEALGFIQITRKGHLRPEGDSGAPSLYRITYLPVYRSDGVDKATNEWRRFESIADARQAVAKYHERASYDRAIRYDKRRLNKVRTDVKSFPRKKIIIQGAL